MVLVSVGGALLMAGCIGAACFAAQPADVDPSPPAATASAEEIARYLDVLKGRGQFGAALEWLDARLDDSLLRPAERAELVVEQSRTYVAQALALPPAEPTLAWDHALETPRRFALAFPQEPRVVLVRLQAALVHLAHGELLRLRGETAADPQPLWSEARTELRAALSELDTLARALAEQLRARPGRATAAALTEPQLRNLEKQLGFQQARARLNLAQTYPAKSPERTDALLQARRQLAPLVQLGDRYPVTWPARLEELACLRLLEEFTDAETRLTQFVADTPPAPIAPQLLAERIRLLLARGQTDAALDLANNAPPEADEAESHAAMEIDPSQQTTAAAELELARLEAVVAAWRRAQTADPPANTAHWQREADALVHALTARFGGYWARRAELLLSGVVAAIPGGDLTLLARSADSLYRSGKFDEALAAYDRAEQAARSKKDLSVAFDLAYRAAAIEHQQQHHASASERFRRLAVDLWENSRAADAHLLAVYNGVQLARDATPEHLKNYRDLLAEHLRYWPSAASAGEIRWQQGRLADHERRRADAVASYRGIPPAHPRAAEAIARLLEIAQQRVFEDRAAGQSPQPAALEAARWFVEQAKPAATAATLAARRAALAAAAELLLAHADGGPAAVEQLLAPEILSRGASSDWVATALPYYVLALLGQNRQEAARQAWEQLSPSPAATLRAVETLARLLPQVPAPQRSAGCELLRSATARLVNEKTSVAADALRRLQTAEAQALAAAGRAEEALDRFSQLAADHPQDAPLVEQQAALLSARDDRASLEAALKLWREVERRSPAASPRWYRAKYELANAHLRLGNRAQAQRIITVTEALHPDLGGPEWLTKFRQLAQRCRP